MFKKLLLSGLCASSPIFSTQFSFRKIQKYHMSNEPELVFKLTYRYGFNPLCFFH